VVQQIGRYEIVSELGRGAMGVVFRALDPAIGRTVAIKTIRLAEFADPAEQSRLRERLLHEARSAGVLSHPGIVTVYDVAEEGGVAYISMEFVRGSSLEHLLSRDEPLGQEAILRVLRETAAALDYAHKKGIVHRDIKPANIMLEDDGAVKVTDFGVAKVAASQQLTQAGAVIGTPNYMSPEQVQGNPVDGRSDEFSLAVIAYEMITGEKPFSSEQLPTLVYKIVHEEPTAPHLLNPTLSWQVEVVLRKALEKDPEARYPACSDFVKAFEGACKSSKGWKPLPRGGSQSIPTIVARKIEPEPKSLDSKAKPPLRPKLGRLLSDEPEQKRWRPGKKTAILGVLALIAIAALVAQDEGLFRLFGPVPELSQPGFKLPEPPMASGRPSPVGPMASGEEPDADVVMPPPEPPEGEPPAETGGLPAAPPAAPQPLPATQQTTEGPAKPETVQPPAAQQARPGEPEQSVVLVRTSPPGATVVFDNDARTACKSPCSLTLAPGRHTTAATLAGHRSALRIFQVPDEVNLFLYLARMSGQVQILSSPPGATILINGKERRERTPTTLDMPVGKYTITVTKDGTQGDQQEIEVKDNAFIRLSFTLPR
jgi:serine/threonine protein kinase